MSATIVVQPNKRLTGVKRGLLTVVAEDTVNIFFVVIGVVVSFSLIALAAPFAARSSILWAGVWAVVGLITLAFTLLPFILWFKADYVHLSYYGSDYDWRHELEKITESHKHMKELLHGYDKTSPAYEQLKNAENLVAELEWCNYKTYKQVKPFLDKGHSHDVLTKQLAACKERRQAAEKIFERAFDYSIRGSVLGIEASHLLIYARDFEALVEAYKELDVA